jgi:4-hydroxy-3-polyprenylbenzoate decarboxylase
MSDCKADITIGITGASGVAYALRLMQVLLAGNHRLHLALSPAARLVLATEANIQLPRSHDAAVTVLRETLEVEGGQLTLYGEQDWMSPLASGSSAPRRMVVVPCTGGALSAIALGASNNLLERAADVVLKEKGRLILVPREMPLSSIHLRHMLTLSDMGAVIMPACPGFYHGAESVDDLIAFVVARILEHLGETQTLVSPWGYTGKSVNS